MQAGCRTKRSSCKKVDKHLQVEPDMNDVEIVQICKLPVEKM